MSNGGSTFRTFRLKFLAFCLAAYLWTVRPFDVKSWLPWYFTIDMQACLYSVPIYRRSDLQTNTHAVRPTSRSSELFAVRHGCGDSGSPPLSPSRPQSQYTLRAHAHALCTHAYRPLIISSDRLSYLSDRLSHCPFKTDENTPTLFQANELKNTLDIC